jgi:dinuclear metal center YbgI/SA1388 family protein
MERTNVTAKEIYTALDRRAPFAWQLDFDNAGFLAGRGDWAVTRVLVALDITPEVIDEAIRRECGLIVSHHPVIWTKPGAITDETATGRKILSLVEHHIAAICAHTNLDAAEGGVNTILARKLGVVDTVPLEPAGTNENGVPYGIGRVGTLAEGPMAFAAFATRVREALAVPALRGLDCGHPVHKVAVGGGACGSMLAEVAALGCDTFVTSEVKHDVYLDARDQGISILDAGHFSTEAPVRAVLAQWLREDFPALEVLETQGETEVFGAY